MKYIILPMQPTPNGRMHIGHGGGTYLRADVLARALRTQGHQVKVACGTDAYENWVLVTAQRDGLPARESCARYHGWITEDLSALDIGFDAWIDPLNPRHEADYIELHRELFRRVKAAPSVSLQTEWIPYAADDGKPLLGTFIAGDCPNCGAAAGGSSCTACSEHFQPEQLLNPRARLSNSAIRWRQEQNWFMWPSSREHLLTSLAATGLAASHLEVAARYLRRTGGKIRISGPGSWGIPCADLPKQHVLANSYFLYCIYAASCVAVEPFRSGSGHVTVGVFGTDNSSPGLIVPGLYSQSTNGSLKAFDHTVVNGMLDLDGQKCSTSKGYGIWLNEAQGSGLLTSSELRYALSGVDLDAGRANLELDRLAEDVNRLRALVHVDTCRAEAGWSIGGGADLDENLLREQQEHLQPWHLDLPAARAVLDRHLATNPNTTSGWLTTLAALADSLMPALAAALRDRRPPATVLRASRLDVSSLEVIVRRGATPTDEPARVLDTAGRSGGPELLA